MELQRGLTGFERSPGVINPARESRVTMQYAIKNSPQLPIWKDMLAVFHSAGNFERFYSSNVRNTSDPCMETWTTLAQATIRFRLGCMVTVLFIVTAFLGGGCDYFNVGRQPDVVPLCRQSFA